MRPDTGETGRRGLHRARRRARVPAGLVRSSGRSSSLRSNIALCRDDLWADGLRCRFAFGPNGVFDAARDRVDGFRVFADRAEGAVLAPAGDIGDRVAADIGPTEEQTMYVTQSTSTSACSRPYCS